MTNEKTLRDKIAEMFSAFAGQQSVVVIPRPYIAFTGDITTALLLSQIIYWSDRAKMKDGWFAKSYIEWDEEIGLSQFQVKRAAKILARAGIETKIKKFDGAPTIHYRVNKDKLSKSIMKFIDNGIPIKSINQEDEETSQSITETTTETTKESTTRTGQKHLTNGASPNVSSDVVESLIETWLAHNTVLDGAPMSQGNKKHFTTMARSGITPQQLGGFMQWKREQRGWSKKNVPVAFIVDEIGEYLEQAQTTPTTYTESELNAMLAQYERTSRHD